MTTKKRRTNISAASRKILKDFEESVRSHEMLGSKEVGEHEYIERRYKRDRGKLVERINRLESEARVARDLVKQLSPRQRSKGIAAHLASGAGAGF